VLGGPDGGQEKDIRQKTIAYGLAESVHFIGPQSDVASWLHIFNLYLFPSLFEGFGIVVIENQLASLKTIASDRVPQSTDLGLGLVSYLPLENKEEWVKNALNHQTVRVEEKAMLASLKDKGFDPQQNLITLIRQYR
jgi:glycosyltransferase EpsF